MIIHWSQVINKCVIPFSHEWWVSQIKFIVEPTILCERGDYTFIFSLKLLNNFPSITPKKRHTPNIVFKIYDLKYFYNYT